MQVGTQFWDENLQNELAEGRLTGVALTGRYAFPLIFLDGKVSSVLELGS